MTKFSTLTQIFAVATISAAGSAPALADKSDSFVHAGTTFTYVETVDHGKRVISGRTSTGGQFRLVVGQRMVSGTFNGAPVRFGLNEVGKLEVALR